MVSYEIQGEGDNRILSVIASAAHRFRFWHLEGKEQVKFKKIGGRLVAAVRGSVQVYKVPTGHEFHREYIAHNARALWLGLQSDPERLVNNMLEYKETI